MRKSYVGFDGKLPFRPCGKRSVEPFDEEKAVARPLRKGVVLPQDTRKLD